MRTYTFRYYVTKTVDVVVDARSIDLITEADSTDIELIDAEDE